MTLIEHADRSYFPIIVVFALAGLIAFGLTPLVRRTMRERATNEIEAEKQRAIGELRGEVADLALAAASRVVGESMTDERQRRLVNEFLTASTQDGDARN